MKASSYFLDRLLQRRNGMRLGVAALLLCSLVAWAAEDTAPAPSSEDLPSGKDLLERHIKAIGGRDALDKLDNRIVKASMEINPMGISGTVITYHARPDKLYTNIEIAGVGTIERGSDGDVFWEKHAMMGPRVLEGEEKAMMALLSRFDMANYEDLFKSIECSGLVDVDGVLCYKVVYTPTEGKPIVEFFDKDTAMSVKSEFSLQTQLGLIKVENTASEYKEVDGVLMPHRTVEKSMGMESLAVIESIEHNAELPEGCFDLPDDIKALVEKAKEGAEEAPAAAAEGSAKEDA